MEKRTCFVTIVLKIYIRTPTSVLIYKKYLFSFYHDYGKLVCQQFVIFCDIIKRAFLVLNFIEKHCQTPHLFNHLPHCVEWQMSWKILHYTLIIFKNFCHGIFFFVLVWVSLNWTIRINFFPLICAHLQRKTIKTANEVKIYYNFLSVLF